MKKNIIKEKSYQFALRIVRISQELNDENRFVLSKQLFKDSNILSNKKAKPILKDCYEIKSILGAILSTLNKQ